MKILLSGINGFMGREVKKLCEAGFENAELVCGVDINTDGCDVPCYDDFDKVTTDAEIVVDFSNHLATKKICEFCINKNLPLVLATTGQTDEEKEIIKKTAEKIPVFFAANFSLGVAVLIGLAKKAAKMFPDADIEIVEVHHNRKLDAPSGTALAIAKEIKNARECGEIKCGRSGIAKREKGDIGISSVRMGNVVGIHEVHICTNNQIITLKHEAQSRALFAEGALTAAKFLIGKPCGLYDMNDIVGKDE